MEGFISASEKYKNSEIEFFQRYYILQMGYAIHVGDTEYGLGFLGQLEKDLKLIYKKIPATHLSWLFYLVSYLHFLDGNPAETKRWLNKFFSIKSNNYSKDLPSLARLLSLMVLFELKNYTRLETETTNVQRFLDRQGVQSVYENEMVRTIRFLVREIGIGSKIDRLHRVQHHIQIRITGIHRAVQVRGHGAVAVQIHVVLGKPPIVLESIGVDGMDE